VTMQTSQTAKMGISTKTLWIGGTGRSGPIHGAGAGGDGAGERARRRTPRGPRKWKFRQRPYGTGDRPRRPCSAPLVRFATQARNGRGRTFPQPLPWWAPASDGAGGTVGVGSHLANRESGNFDKDPY